VSSDLNIFNVWLYSGCCRPFGAIRWSIGWRLTPRLFTILLDGMAARSGTRSRHIFLGNKREWAPVPTTRTEQSILWTVTDKPAPSRRSMKCYARH
jgi:hypothetical protein